MTGLVTLVLLPSLLLLSFRVTLGHAKPYSLQGGNDDSNWSHEAMPDARHTYHQAVNDGTVVIGDMLVPHNLYQQYFNSSYVAPRKGVPSDSSLWPKERDVYQIPFEFADERYKTEIIAGLNHWGQHTCLTFRRRRVYDRSWIRFIHGNGCYSVIGRVNDGQDVSIGTGCQGLKTVVHEVGHALGLFHEQMRSDRDDYVVINWHNLEENSESNFIKYNSDNRGVPYDYTSIMQYSGRAFSANGRVTIATNLPEHQELLNRREELSHRDKHIINIMYGCIDTWKNICEARNCEGEGYLGADCRCVCPPGREGDRCEVKRTDYYADALPACSRNIITETSFTSPNYPEEISPDTWCVYKVEAPVGQVPEVIFQSFSLFNVHGTCHDLLEVRDSSLHDGKVFCRSDIKKGQSFVGASRLLYLLLEVHTSSSKGFLAEVVFHDADNPPKPKSGVSGLAPSILAVLVALLAAQV